MTAGAKSGARKLNLGSPHRIPFGEGRVFTVDGMDVAVFRTRSGTVYATQAWCSHQGGPLADGMVGNGKVICPLHGYRFSLRTGAPDGHDCPAIKTYPIAVSPNGELMLTLPGEGHASTAPATTAAARRTGPLTGRTVGVLEARMGETLAGMFAREGATIVAAPALLERPVDAMTGVREWVDAVVAGAYDLVVFLTGVGANCLLDEVARLGRLDETREALLRTTVMARGPKPASALNRRGVTVTVTVPEPWTSRECIDTLRRLALADRRVALVHYGERSAALANAIVGAGAALDELCLYEWRLPEDVTPLEELTAAVIAGRVDVVVFTSQVQVRHLLDVAARSDRRAALVDALNTRSLTASIGPTCSAALVERGIAPHIEPSRPKLGPLVERVVSHFASLPRSSVELRT